MLVPSSNSRGFTLIELMIGLTIVAMILAIGVPSFGVWIQNTKIRNAADAMANGLQLARAEAVRRNTAVLFAGDSGSGWTVSAGGNTIQTRPASDGSDNISVVFPGGSTQVTFNGVGAITSNADSSASLTQVDISSTIAAVSDGARPLRVVVSLAGSVRMCDPNVSPSDTRAC